MLINQKPLSRKKKKRDHSENLRNLQNRQVKKNLLKWIG